MSRESVCQVACSWGDVGSCSTRLFGFVYVTWGDLHDRSEKGTASVHLILIQSWETCYVEHRETHSETHTHTQMKIIFKIIVDIFQSTLSNNRRQNTNAEGFNTNHNSFREDALNNMVYIILK
jgi:hypothetical protein